MDRQLYGRCQALGIPLATASKLLHSLELLLQARLLQHATHVLKPCLATGALVPMLQSWQPAPYCHDVIYMSRRRLSWPPESPVDYL